MDKPSAPTSEVIIQGEWDRWHNSTCGGDKKCMQNFNQKRCGENYILLEYVMWFGGEYHHFRTICCCYIHGRHPADGSSVISLKCSYSLTQLHTVVSKKTIIFIQSSELKGTNCWGAPGYCIQQN